ncbi:MAG TPA: hypothetical protein VJT73_16285 [Polyangiaceae bacterium]|nr:hypothetical protein [Polyangiaceae bacterium]
MRTVPAGAGVRRLVRIVAVATVWACLAPGRAEAAEIPGATLSVARAVEARACSDEESLARDLRARMTATSDRGLGRLLLSVELAREGDEFVATIHVDGRKQGIRRLASRGPTCEGLHEALMVSMLLLLDEDPLRPEPPVPAAEVVPRAAPAAPPIASPQVERRAGPPPSFWFMAGSAATHGMPLDFSGAVFADAAVRFRAFELSLGGVWAPTRAHDVATARYIDVGLAGGRARGCYAFWDRAVRISGCGTAVVVALSGTGQGIAGDFIVPTQVRTWVSVGAGPDASFALSSRIGVGISAAVAAQTRTTSFHFENAVSAGYATDALTGWVAVDVRVRIW